MRARFVQEKSARTKFREWLFINERRHARCNARLLGLRAYYHAARLRRLYLRTILKRIAQSVCAGGPPALKWRTLNAIRSWDSNGIDACIHQTLTRTSP